MAMSADPYLQALDDVGRELTRLQLAGPDYPAFHRGQILEQLGILAGKIEDLRRARQAPAQDPGPVPAPLRFSADVAADIAEWDAQQRW
jgi:hypothetical protein